MPEETRYSNSTIRDRIEIVNNRVTELRGDVNNAVTLLTGQQKNHVQVSYEKFSTIISDVAELRALLNFYAKIGFWLAVALL